MDVDDEQIATDQENDDVEDKHIETDAIQSKDQLQEIKGMEQDIDRETDQKEKIYMDEKEITDVDKSCGRKDVHIATQNKAEQEIGTEKQGSVGKEEQLDDTCDIEATPVRINVVLDEQKEECTGLQHGNDNDQVNLTIAENEPTHSEVVATESVEVHQTSLQEVCLQQDQFVKPSTKIDTKLDPDEIEAREESKDKTVTLPPLEVHKEQTVSIEQLIQTGSKVQAATIADAQQEKKEGKGVP